jgi:hypothetical protein
VTDAEIRQAAREAAERSAREQGLPPRVVDERPIADVAAIMRGAVAGVREDRAA